MRLQIRTRIRAQEERKFRVENMKQEAERQLSSEDESSVDELT